MTFLITIDDCFKKELKDNNLKLFKKINKLK